MMLPMTDPACKISVHESALGNITVFLDGKQSKVPLLSPFCSEISILSAQKRESGEEVSLVACDSSVFSPGGRSEVKVMKINDRVVK